MDATNAKESRSLWEYNTYPARRMPYIYQPRVKGIVWFATMLWKIRYLLMGKYSLNWRKWDYRYVSHVVKSTALWQTNTSWVPQSGMEQSCKVFRLNPFSTHELKIMSGKIGSGSWISSCSFTHAANIRKCSYMPESSRGVRAAALQGWTTGHILGILTFFTALHIRRLSG